MQETVTKEKEEYVYVGKGVPRVDGYKKVTGKAVYTVDVDLPGMLHGKILRSPVPHALIKSIDTSRAEALPGVKAVITGKDTQGIRFGFVETPHMPADMPPLAEDKVRYVGEAVAAVAATSERIAVKALDLIEVEYKPLPAVFHPEKAMEPEAPKIHDIIPATGPSFWQQWGVERESTPQKVERNICSEIHVEIGDIEEGFAKADYIREDRFETNVTAHGALEPHGVVARYTRDKLDVWLSHMGPYMKRYWLARTMGLPDSKVRVHHAYIGGAFGGKIDLFDYEFIASYLSKITGRPVRIVLTRKEVFQSTRLRHPMVFYVKTGVKRNGKITALDVTAIDDTGAYRGTGPVVVYLAHAFSIPLYRIPNVNYKGYAVYTNNPVRVAMRGHGAPQARFAMEQQLDMIAEDIGMSPIDIRLINVREQGEVLPNGDILNSCGLRECIERSAERSDFMKKYGKNRGKGRGIGIGLTSMFSGAQFYPFGATGVVLLHDDGSATIFSGAVEFGQGSDTMMCQIVAEELGIDIGKVSILSADSELCPIALDNWLSGGTFVNGRAVQLAARNAKEQLLSYASQILGVSKEELDVRDGEIFSVKDPSKKISHEGVIKYAIHKSRGKQIVGVGHATPVEGAYWYPSLRTGKGKFTGAYSFSASVAEVEVDMDTGVVRVLKIINAHDCGYPINPILVEGQAEGQGYMGMAQVLMENIVEHDGVILNSDFLEYKMPTALDIPEMETIHIETRDPNGPFGGKEVGEGVIAGVVAAIANAIYDATGVRFHTLPITPDVILKGLKEKRMKEERQ
jgi:4-hydroxybenzoyl-CoA reductase subunit alpha